MKLKLTTIQIYRLKMALHESSEALREIKQKPLKGEAFDDMKAIEQAVQNLECVLLGHL